MQITPEVIDQILAGKISVQQALDVSPGIVEMIAVLGSQFYEQGSYPDARQLFEGAVALDPGNYMGHAGLGGIALADDQIEAALGHLGRAYGLNAKDPAVCGNLGEAYLRNGDRAEAIRYLKESASLDPHRTNSFANRARGILLAVE